MLTGRCVGNSLFLEVPPAVFDTLGLHLKAKTRYTYDYATSHLLIHGLPTAYHEVGTPIIRALENHFHSQLGPRVRKSSALANLQSDIVWNYGALSVRMLDNQGNRKAEKVPDVSIGIDGRQFPTVVVEVGKTQSLRSLRAAGRLWFAHELAIPSEEQSVRNSGREEKSPQIELVILIDFSNGPRNGTEEPSESHGVEVQADTPGGHSHSEHRGPHDTNKKFTHVYLELWRSCNPSSCRSALQQHIPASHSHRQTRSSTSRVRLNPQMCQRLQIYPLAYAHHETATFYLSDFVGSEVFNDPNGKWRMDVPAMVFGNCVERIERMMLGLRRGMETIQAEDVDEEMESSAHDMQDKPSGGDSGKENVGGLQRVLLEKVNSVGEEMVGKRKNGGHVGKSMQRDQVVGHGGDDGVVNSPVKRRRGL